MLALGRSRLSLALSLCRTVLKQRFEQHDAWRFDSEPNRTLDCASTLVRGCCAFGSSVEAIVSGQVHYNLLIGSLPKAVGMLTKLRSLCVAIILRPRCPFAINATAHRLVRDNQLTGELPNQIGQLSLLQFLYEMVPNRFPPSQCLFDSGKFSLIN